MTAGPRHPPPPGEVADSLSDLAMTSNRRSRPDTYTSRHSGCIAVFTRRCPLRSLLPTLLLAGACATAALPPAPALSPTEQARRVQPCEAAAVLHAAHKTLSALPDEIALDPALVRHHRVALDSLRGQAEFSLLCEDLGELHHALADGHEVARALACLGELQADDGESEVARTSLLLVQLGQQTRRANLMGAMVGTAATTQGLALADRALDLLNPAEASDLVSALGTALHEGPTVHDVLVFERLSAARNIAVLDWGSRWNIGWSPGCVEALDAQVTEAAAQIPHDLAGMAALPGLDLPAPAWPWLDVCVHGTEKVLERFIADEVTVHDRLTLLEDGVERLKRDGCEPGDPPVLLGSQDLMLVFNDASCRWRLEE